MFPQTIEDFLQNPQNRKLILGQRSINDDDETRKPWKCIAIAAVHSHARLHNYIPQICSIMIQHSNEESKTLMFIVTIPCCLPQELKPGVLKETKLTELPEVVDMNIHSVKRRVIRYVTALSQNSNVVSVSAV